MPFAGARGSPLLIDELDEFLREDHEEKQNWRAPLSPMSHLGRSAKRNKWRATFQEDYLGRNAARKKLKGALILGVWV